MKLFPDPPVGFHFSVVFEIFPQQPNDFRFQEVTGLDVSVEMEPYIEGGQNRYTHQLPVRTTYSDITLKRGLFIGSGIILWVNDAIENFSFKPANLLISLLDENDADLKKMIYFSLTSITGYNYRTKGEWTAWWEKNKP